MALAKMSNGDARTVLNILEYAGTIKNEIGVDEIKEAFQKSHLLYDKDGDEHYNIISALHKSMRGSDATHPCTGWPGCSKEGKILCISLAGWYASPPKISDWRIPALWSRRFPFTRLATF